LADLEASLQDGIRAMSISAALQNNTPSCTSGRALQRDNKKSAESIVHTKSGKCGVIVNWRGMFYRKTLVGKTAKTFVHRNGSNAAMQF
jgi:hypothetical protein